MQILIVLLTALSVFALAYGFYWIFSAGQGYFQQGGNQSPFMSPFLWGAIILVAIAAGFSRIWRWYIEKRFIRLYKKAASDKSQAAHDK
ncbi:hypothetical protein [Gayadomonas joobiniege]|uniref:hypothetical protein n=1 Tax=Gayadomonas joobiniege TaxID=1234606 RepID=UPI0012DE698B|nr:hypothetical protein [Gayadomonas joobiniege]